MDPVFLISREAILLAAGFGILIAYARSRYKLVAAIDVMTKRPKKRNYFCRLEELVIRLCINASEAYSLQ
jgi:hypothetical protein